MTTSEKPDPGPSPKLSIIIVNYNTGAYLRYCLASIQASPPSKTFEVIVVDNGSSDESAGMVATRFPDVRFISSPKNLGFAGGNNLGFSQARGELVFILNPDTVVLPGCLDFLISYLEANPRAGAVGPWIRDREPDILAGAGSQQMPGDEEQDRITLGRYQVRENVQVREKWVNRFGRLRIPIIAIRLLLRSHTDVNRPARVDWVLNCASLIRRADVTRDYLMDEGWIIGTEEIEFCCSFLRPRGFDFFIIPKAQIIHFGGRSYEGRPEWSAQLYPLMHAAIYARRSEIFGPVWARLDAVIGLLDHLALYLGLATLQLVRPAALRREMISIYRLLLSVNLRLAWRGMAEANKINKQAREWLPGASKAR